MTSNSLLNIRHIIMFLGSMGLFSLIFLARLIVVVGVPFYFFSIIFGGLLLFFLKKEKIFFINLQEFFVLVFMFWLLVPVVNAYNFSSSALQYYYYLISFLLFFLIRRFCFNKQVWSLMANSLLLGGGLTSILMILNWNVILQGDRVNLNDINANYLAYSLVTLLPILYIFFNNKYYKFYYILLGLFSIAIFLTGSRGALIALAFFYIILAFKKPIFGLIIALFAASFFTMFVGFYDSLPAYWQARFDVQGSTGGDMDWTSGREATWSSAWKLSEEHYIFGIGLNNFPEISGFGINVHNVFLSLLVETGILGVLFYFFSFLSIVFFVLRRNFLLGLILFVIEIPIFFTGVWESSPVLWSVLSLLMAYGVLFNEKISERKF